jgi:hypothetical protein
LKQPKTEAAELYSSIRLAENEFKTKEPRLYEFALKIGSLEAENAALEKKFLSISGELGNYKTHIEVMRSSHEAKSLQDYYNKEYEILPLWYKRLGHFVKVLTGKRSFRSLFNDNTKKYKD